MVTIEIAYKGELRCQATHLPSSAQLHTDAPVDNCGRGEGFSPTDLVATALGTCMLTIMGIVAQRHGWKLGGMTVTVTKEMTGMPNRRIARLGVRIRVPGEFSAHDRLLLERSAQTCPVHRSLHPDVQAPVVFEWGDSTGSRQ